MGCCCLGTSMEASSSPGAYGMIVSMRTRMNSFESATIPPGLRKVRYFQSVFTVGRPAWMEEASLPVTSLVSSENDESSSEASTILYHLSGK